jgi:hypothetical protein
LRKAGTTSNDMIYPPFLYSDSIIASETVFGKAHVVIIGHTAIRG